MLQEGKLKAVDKKAIKYEFSEKYVVSEKLVADYIEHLTDIEMRKDKRPTDNDRKGAERKQQEYNDIDWERPVLRWSMENGSLPFLPVLSTTPSPPPPLPSKNVS